ncbi:MAG: hypothetical protein IKZ47_06010 [Clostridia bacterium]|nr:hypothetical protein [Clostridia bacterium]
MWFLLALLCLLFWGTADLFYKKGTDESDRYSHLKIAVWVGLVMGVFAFALMPLSETGFSVRSLFDNAIKYSPASLGYIVSMVIGYAGLRYLEVSVVSPVQNASGAFSAIAMLVWFSIRGVAGEFFGDYWCLNVAGTAVIVIGVIGLGIVEQNLSRKEKSLAKEERKYRFGALALIFPILYCVFDTVGTTADGIILNEETGLGLGEIDVLIIYGLTFFVAGIVAWAFLWVKNKKPYNLFSAGERTKGMAALCEEGGQIFYVYAMAARPLLAAPMISAYCIVSVILSRIFLKEKLKALQYACVIAVIAGIIMLGILEGIEEAAG